MCCYTQNLLLKPQSLHVLLQIRQSPETGREELIVLAGYCQNVLAAMNPYRLDLTTFEWGRESGLVRDPKEGDPQELPRARQRSAAERVGNQWLLLLGGSPTQVRYADTLPILTQGPRPGLHYWLQHISGAKQTAELTTATNMLCFAVSRTDVQSLDSSAVDCPLPTTKLKQQWQLTRLCC